MLLLPFVGGVFQSVFKADIQTSFAWTTSGFRLMRFHSLHLYPHISEQAGSVCKRTQPRPANTQPPPQPFVPLLLVTERLNDQAAQQRTVTTFWVIL